MPAGCTQVVFLRLLGTSTTRERLFRLWDSLSLQEHSGHFGCQGSWHLACVQSVWEKSSSTWTKSTRKSGQHTFETCLGLWSLGCTKLLSCTFDQKIQRAGQQSSLRKSCRECRHLIFKAHGPMAPWPCRLATKGRASSWRFEGIYCGKYWAKLSANLGTPLSDASPRF